MLEPEEEDAEVELTEEDDKLLLETEVEELLAILELLALVLGTTLDEELEELEKLVRVELDELVVVEVL
jgi:hypothetical protein